MKHILLILVLASAAPAAPTASAPATLSKEGDLMKIVLTPEAEQRLRLKVVAIERRVAPAVRLFSGEVVRSLSTGNGSVAPVIGGTLDEVLRMSDLQAAADGRVLQAHTQVNAAKIALARAEKVFSAEAGSVRAVDEAKAALALAEAALGTATAQRSLLGSPVNSRTGSQRSWVRVAIYSGESGLLDSEATATIRAAAGSGLNQTVKPISGPPTANALTNSIDWYYELPGDARLRAGERVAVEISLRDSKTEHLVVPFSAVLHDIHGGQWVYEAIAPHTYARRRIQVARLAGDMAVLATGPVAGTKIVTDGSAELFGTEFMTGK